MSDVVSLVIVFVAGIGLGLFYFGLLWGTIRYLPRARRPELLTLGSFVIRTGVILMGFYLVMGGRWERVLVCLGGFLVVRQLMLRRGKQAPAPIRR